MTNYLQCQLYIWVCLPWIFSYFTLLQTIAYEPSHHQQNGIISFTSFSNEIFFLFSTLLLVTGSLSTTASPTHTSQLLLSHFPSKTPEYITCYQCCHSFLRNNQEIGTYPRLLAATRVERLRNSISSLFRDLHEHIVQHGSGKTSKLQLETASNTMWIE